MRRKSITPFDYEMWGQGLVYGLRAIPYLTRKTLLQFGALSDCQLSPRPSEYLSISEFFILEALNIHSKENPKIQGLHKEGIYVRQSLSRKSFFEIFRGLLKSEFVELSGYGLGHKNRKVELFQITPKGRSIIEEWMPFHKE